MNILALDIGTTSMRGILFDDCGSVLHTHTVPTPLLFEGDGGAIEQRPQAYTDGTLAICRAIAATEKVDALSITAFRSAPTLVTRQGDALCNFIMWQDTRNSDICNRLRHADDDVRQTCGASVNTVFTGAKLTWLKENRPELYARAYKAMVVPDYVVRFMTGVFATDRTYGSRTLLMNLHTLQWDARMCALFGIDMEKLCPLRDQGSVIGRIHRPFSQMTGIAEGTPVISAGGDQQCGALGLGVMDNTTIEVNSGTGSFVISLTDKPYLDSPSILCNAAAIPGMYTLEMNIISSASAVNWLMQSFFPECWGEEPDFDAFNRMAGESPPGANGLYAVPHFQGCGSRDWNPQAKAGFWGFTLSSQRSDLARALYEGIAAEIAKSIDMLPETCRGAASIAVAGGLSKSNLYNQILCDMTGRTLKRCLNTQATAMGAFLSAAVTLGLYRDYRDALSAVSPEVNCSVFLPNAENTRFYQGYKRMTEQLYQAARPPREQQHTKRGERNDK